MPAGSARASGRAAASERVSRVGAEHEERKRRECVRAREVDLTLPPPPPPPPSSPTQLGLGLGWTYRVFMEVVINGFLVW